MPVYAYHCEKCREDFDRYLPLKDYDLPQRCDECGNVGRKVLQTGAVFTDFKAYQSQIDGTIIESREQHRKHLKEHGKVEIGNTSVETLQKMTHDAQKELRQKRKKDIIKDVEKAVYATN